MAAVFAPITAANLAIGYRLYRTDRYLRRLASKFGLKRVYKHGKKYIIGAVGGYFGAKMSKRARISDSGMATQRYGGGGIDAGATNVVQRSWHKSRSGKRPRQNAKLALRLLKAAQSYAVVRYQRLSNYEGSYDASLDVGPTAVGPPIVLSDNRPLPLGFVRYTNGSPNTDTRYSMPVQLFDLTSLSFNAEGGAIRHGYCNYNLTYDNANGDYFWRASYGKGPKDNADAYSGVQHWWVERSPSGNIQGALPQVTKSCYTPWVDIRMILYGATTETTRFTVMMVQLTDEFFDPNVRDRGNTGGDQTTEIGQRQQTFNQYWNTVMKTRVFNPIASAGVKTQPIFKVLSKKTYVVGPDSSTNFDVNQPNVICKKFYNMNRIQKYDWFKPDVPAEPAGDAQPSKIDTVNEVVGDNYNQYMLNDTKPYVHPKAKVFLMVVADSYSQQTYGVPTTIAEGALAGTYQTGLPTNGVTKVPCMDIVIRKKIVYDDT